MDELLTDFLAETVEALAAIDDALVRFEREPQDRATLDAVFRLVHTIKGGCGFLDLPRLEALAHAAETVLGRVRDGALPVSTGLVTGVLAAIDGIKAIVGVLGAKGAEPEGDDAALIHLLGQIADGDAVDADVVVAETTHEMHTAQTIRVPLALLERLMDTVSELVLTRNQLVQMSRSGRDPETLGMQFSRLSQCITTIQDGVMRTRMQPIERVWGTLPRLVRRLALDLGKRIDVEFSGGDVEIDRQMLELIKDPLQHMVRNAADHGLESPADRKKAGKPEGGRIRIEAAQEGGQIVIRFSDDGRGLDLLALRAKAAANGVMSEGAALRLPNGEAARLVFHPGLSTAEAVTSVSGRGVGMDVVRANLEKIGGSVDVETTYGRGTCFTLRIPLTLAIVPALVAEAVGERFAIPQVAVLELVEIGGDGIQVEHIHDAPVIRLRGALLPLVDLGAILGMVRADHSAARFVIVAQAACFRYGLMVDELFDTEEIVVKPVAPLLADLAAYCGNTVLSDGRAAMILDVGGIAGLARLEADIDDGADELAALDATETLLLFNAGSDAPLAIPLAQIERIEDLPASALEQVGGRCLVQYRGGLLPVIDIDARSPAKRPRQQMLVLSNGDRPVGLAIDSVVDIVEQKFDLVASARVMRIGNAVIGGHIAEIIDAQAYIGAAAIIPPKLERAA